MMRIASFTILIFFIAIPYGMTANPAIIWGSGGYAENLATSGIKMRSGNVIDDESATVLSTDGDIRVGNGSNKEFLVQDSLFRVMSTGLESPNGLSVNSGDDTLYDIAATEGQIIDTTLGTYVPISYAGETGLSPATSNGVTYVYINSSGDVVTETSLPTGDDRREKLYVGRVITVGGTVTQVLDEPVVAENVANSFYDLAKAIRIFNQEGNVITANGTNLNIDKSAGKVFSAGANYTTDRNNPHSKTVSSCTACTFAYITQNLGSTGADTTSFDPENYDVGGTITAIPGPNRRSSIQKVYLFPSGNIRIQYGQEFYNNISDALENVGKETFIENPAIQGNGILIALIVSRKDATDLSDTDDVKILYPSRFGESAVGSAGLSTSSLQDAYNNSIDGGITLDSTKGNVKILDNSTPLLAPFFSVLSNDELTTYFSVSQGEVITEVDLKLNGTGQLKFPVGTTAQRPTPSTGSSRFNSDEECLEIYDGADWVCVGTGGGGSAGINFVVDPSFEGGDLTFDSSEGKQSETYIAYTADDRYASEFNEQYYQLTSNVPSGTTDIEFDLSVARTNLEGKQGFASFIAASADDFVFCIKVDGNADCQSGTEKPIRATDAEFYEYKIPFVFGASSVELSATVADTAASVQLFSDEIYIGTPPDGFIQELGQASFVGKVTTPTTTDCLWQNTSSSYSSYSPDADCPTPNVVGSLQAPDTKIPAFKIPNARTDGYYLVRASGLFYLGGGSDASYKLSDGTNQEGYSSAFSVNDTRSTNDIVGSFKFNSGGEKTIEVISKVTSGSSSGASIQANASGRILEFIVHFFPDSSASAVTQQTELTAQTANELTAIIDMSGTPSVTNENYSGWIDSITDNGTGRLTIEFDNLNLANSMSCIVGGDSSTGNNPVVCGKDTNFTTDETQYSFSCKQGTTYLDRSNVPIVCSKQDSDVNKSQTIVGKFANINDTPLCQVEAFNTSTDTITQDTEDIPFDDEVTDNCNAWSNGGNTGSDTKDQFTAQKDGFLSISIGTWADATESGWSLITYINGVQNDYCVRNNSDSINIGACIIKVNEGDLVTFRTSDTFTYQPNSGSTIISQLKITELPDLSAIVENLADNPRTARSDQYSESEIEWGEWNGEQLYRRCLTISSDITTTDTLVASWESGLNPKGLTNNTSDFWVIDRIANGSNAVQIEYNSADGEVRVFISGTWKFGEGSSYCMDYTK